VDADRNTAPSPFRNRRDAGRVLAERVAALASPFPVVLALPRGGVPVAYEVAVALRAPLDVLVVRKLGAPQQPELAIGAIGEDDVRLLNADLIRRVGVTARALEAIEDAERKELTRRGLLYRQGRDRIDLSGSTAIVVDDGVATGATARVGCRIARAQGAAAVVLAVPVAPYGWTPGDDADRFVAVMQPVDFSSVGGWYMDFDQTTDAQVTALLRRDTTAS
jgi:predicted phosphoribosyltransferase